MKRFFLCTLLFAAALAVNCTEDEPILFGDIYGTVTNSQTGEPVSNAQVVLSPSGASTISGSDGRFEFRSLDVGQYSISVSSDGYESNSRQVTVVPGQSTSCDIHLIPQAIVEIFNIDPLTLNFGTTQTQLAVTVTNDSPNETQWSLDLGQNTWLKATPIAGQLGAGKKQTIVFSANRASLTQETSGIVTFSALGGSSSLTANCSPSQQVSSIMEVTPLDIDFGDLSTEQVFRIKNTSSALLNWTIFGIEAEALSVSDTSGSIQPGNAKVVSIKLDRSKMDGNHLTTSFMISDGTVDQQVNINVGSHESNVSNNPDQPTNEPMGRLELPSLMLDFGVDYKSLPFTINNAGDATLDWSIIDVQDEIFSFSPDSGTLEAGNSTEIQVSIDRENLPAGSAESAFTISDGVNKYVVTVKYEEPEYTDGKIKLTTDTVDFGTEETLLYFGVENVGTTYLSWTASDIPEYITFNYGHLTSKQGMESTINNRVELNRETMPDEVDTYITITNDYDPKDTHKVHILATKEGSNTPDYTKGLIQVSPTSIDFGTNETSDTLFIKNIGTDWLEWTITGFPESGYLKMIDDNGFTYSGGSMIAGNTMDVNIVLDRDIMPDEVDTYITVINKYNSEDTHQVRITATKEGSGSSEDGYDYTKGLIQVSPTTIDFGTTETKEAFSVTNIGPDWLEWDVTDLPEYLSVIDDQDVSIAGGAIQAGLTREFYFTLNRETMPDNVDAYIPIKNNYNSEDTHQVHITASKENTTTTADSKIYYTSTDGNVVTLPGVVIKSNVYENGQGVITFDGEIDAIGMTWFYNDYGKKLTSITIPEGVTSIERSAFTWCENLASVNFPTTLTSIGENAFAYCKKLTSINIPETVASIGERAFESCSSLTSITIPNGVESIGNRAFYGCNLSSIDIPSSITTIGGAAFLNNSNLSKVNITDLRAWCNIDFEEYDANPIYVARNLYINNTLVPDLVIPDDVTIIKQCAFYNCRTIRSVTLPTSVTEISFRAFSSCDNLMNIMLNEGLTTIGVQAFEYCENLTEINIPSSVREIQGGAFGDCTALSQVNITDINAWCKIKFTEYEYDSNPVYWSKNLYLNGAPVENVVISPEITSISTMAFMDVQSLKSIQLPESVTSIGANAFDGCVNLESCNIPNGVTTLEDDIFNGCTNLKSINIPNGVTSIGEAAFYGCSSLTGISIPSNVTSIGREAFLSCSGLTGDITIPSGVTTIESGTFSGCENLQNISIPNTVSKIESRAFASCSSLTTINIPEGITTLAEKLFSGCDSLKEITIPSTVESIGSQVFLGCGITKYYLKPIFPPSIETYMAFDSSDRTFYVPMTSVDSYKAHTEWKTWADKIVGYDF